MAAIFAFKCTCCGEVHEGSPSVAFDSPWHYHSLSADQKKSIATLSSDFCTITHDEGIDRFIRAVLEVPIEGAAEPFTWGVWVSLSANSFARYEETYDAPVAGDGFFGTLCNRLPGYPNTIALHADVRVQLDGLRPLVVLHQSKSDHAHPLETDQREGISIARAQELAELTTHGT
jgi:hypothetical protein